MSEDGSGSSSKLRLSAAKANGRLLKGYGPLAALLVAFVLMAMLVPTKAPQPSSGGVWLHEAKHDGLRVILAKTAIASPPRSRPGNQLTCRTNIAARVSSAKMA